MSRILLLDPALGIIADRIRAAFPNEPVEWIARPTLDDLERHGADAEIVAKAFNPLPEGALDRLPNLRFIQLIGVGYDSLDIEACRARGIRAACNPGVNAIGMAEHTIMLMLAWLKQMIPGDMATRANTFSNGATLVRGIGDLDGATVGLIGFGPIARAVATRVQAFCSDVLYTTRTRLPRDEEARLGVEWAEFDDLLGRSNIVSMHLALTPETRRTMDARAFGLMKPGALFVNTARGGLVDEEALRAAIVSGHLGGAALDVIEHEQDGGNPFTDLERVIMTPHIGGGSRGSFGAMADRSIANIRRYLAGDPIHDPVPGLE